MDLELCWKLIRSWVKSRVFGFECSTRYAENDKTGPRSKNGFLDTFDCATPLGKPAISRQKWAVFTKIRLPRKLLCANLIEHLFQFSQKMWHGPQKKHDKGSVFTKELSPKSQVSTENLTVIEIVMRWFNWTYVSIFSEDVARTPKNRVKGSVFSKELSPKSQVSTENSTVIEIVMLHFKKFTHSRN